MIIMHINDILMHTKAYKNRTKNLTISYGFLMMFVRFMYDFVELSYDFCTICVRFRMVFL